MHRTRLKFISNGIIVSALLVVSGCFLIVQPLDFWGNYNYCKVKQPGFYGGCWSEIETRQFHVTPLISRIVGLTHVSIGVFFLYLSIDKIKIPITEGGSKNVLSVRKKKRLRKKLKHN